MLCFALTMLRFALTTLRFALTTLRFALTTLRFALTTLCFALTTLHFALTMLRFALTMLRPHTIAFMFTMLCSHSIAFMFTTLRFTCPPPPPQHSVVRAKRSFWTHFSHSEIMLCFTKVFSSKDQLLCPDVNADLRSCQFKKMWNFKTATLWSELCCTKSSFLLKTAEIITASNSIYFVTCYEEHFERRTNLLSL